LSNPTLLLAHPATHLIVRASLPAHMVTVSSHDDHCRSSPGDALLFGIPFGKSLEVPENKIEAEGPSTPDV